MFKAMGRTLDVNYETGYHFKVEYMPDGKLRWTSLAERTDGMPYIGEESYYLHEQTDDIATVSWIEDSGVSVTQNLDFAKMEVYAFMSWNALTARGGRAVLAHKGSIAFMD